MSPRVLALTDETGAGKPGVLGQQKGAPVGSKVRKIQTTPLASQQRLSVQGSQKRVPSFEAGLGAALV